MSAKLLQAGVWKDLEVLPVRILLAWESGEQLPSWEEDIGNEQGCCV